MAGEFAGIELNGELVCSGAGKDAERRTVVGDPVSAGVEQDRVVYSGT